MQDGTNIGKPLGRVIDIPATGQSERIGTDQPGVDHHPSTDLPDGGGKWPLPLRVVFIAGSAAALWGLIFLAISLF
jgi:hypothetical protein